jgi:hypothetical protein
MARQCHLSSHIGNFSLAFRPHGRLYLLPREEFIGHAQSLTLLGYVELTEDEFRTYLTLQQSMRHTLEQERSVVCDYLSRHGFESVCRELLALSEHMAPLIYYVGERCISNFYNVGKSGFELENTLTGTLEQVIAQRENSSVECLIVAYCLHLLSRSGSYTRLEELNSTQVSCHSLKEYFDAKHVFYQSVGASHPGTATGSFDASSLEEKAVMLACMRQSSRPCKTPPPRMNAGIAAPLPLEISLKFISN